MDDIDRLTVDKNGQLLGTIKAVADFPNTVYLLAFYHSVVADSLSRTLHLDGHAYLEKNRSGGKMPDTRMKVVSKIAARRCSDLFLLH